MVSSTTFFAAILAFSTATVLAAPTDTVVDNNYSHCWKNTKDTTSARPDKCGSKVWTETSYTSGVENFNYLFNSTGGLPGVSTTTYANTAGPEHCCSYCGADPNCLGWLMNSDSDCSCQIWTSNVPCNSTTINLTGAFGYSGAPVTNTTSSYHVWLGNGNCNL